jgi:replication initiation and membrane attachment protein DnaB
MTITIDKEKELLEKLKSIHPLDLIKDICDNRYKLTEYDFNLVNNSLLERPVLNWLIYYCVSQYGVLDKTMIDGLTFHWLFKDVKTIEQACLISKKNHKKYQLISFEIIHPPLEIE